MNIIAVAQHFANQEHAKYADPRDAANAYFAEMCFWRDCEAVWKLDSLDGIWLFFNYNDSVETPGNDRLKLASYQDWKALKKRIASIASKSGHFQGGISYEVDATGMAR